MDIQFNPDQSNSCLHVQLFEQAIQYPTHLVVPKEPLLEESKF
jgi:hypothetical protein